MSQSNEAALKGSTQKYRVHPDAKRYTMRDNAFTETKNGNFQYERVLSTKPGVKSAPKLKLTVSKDFTNLKMSSVAANGIKKVDLYGNDQMEEARELAEFYLKTFVEEGILEKV
jgi:hypothetical protein